MICSDDIIITYKYRNHTLKVVKMFLLTPRIYYTTHLSRLMGKPTICICENKDADQLCGYISFAVTAKLISAFVFATRIVQFHFYLNPKFQASSCFLCLYRPVCVRPVRKPHCWFSHEAAHLSLEVPINQRVQ